MSLRSVNLNLIPILQALLHEQSIAATASALDMSPAAVSEALGRLRVLLEDPLLVRVGRVMRLTPKAVELIEPVDRLCAEVSGLLSLGRSFEPQLSKRHFKIASNDCQVLLTAQRILDAVRVVAPTAQVHFSDPRPDVGQQMSAREVDFLLMPRFFIDQMAGAESIRFRTLYRDRLVIVFSERHPLARRTDLRIGDIEVYPQIIYNPETAPLEGRLEREVMGGASFNVAMRVAQLTSIPALVAQPPYISWLPLSLAEHLRQPLGLQWREVPLAAPSLDVCLAWSRVHESDSAHHWFRELLIATLAER